jgi:hypothetical protein
MKTNLGLSTDWSHPDFWRMVIDEERAWSLEHYIFGDPCAVVMSSFLTPESRSSGGGCHVSSFELTRRDPDRVALAHTTMAGMELTRRNLWRHGEQRPEGTEQLRRDALRMAESVGLPVAAIVRAVDLYSSARRQLSRPSA